MFDTRVEKVLAKPAAGLPTELAESARFVPTAFVEGKSASGFTDNRDTLAGATIETRLGLGFGAVTIEGVVPTEVFTQMLTRYAGRQTLATDPGAQTAITDALRELEPQGRPGRPATAPGG